MIDHIDFDGALARLEFEAELLLQGRIERGE